MKGKSGKFLLAGVIGAIAGAISGLLLAPKSGKETREDIAKLALKIQSDLKTSGLETKSKIKEIFGNVSKEASAKYEKVKSAVVEKVAAVKNAGNEVSKESYAMIVDDVISEFKDDLKLTKNSVKKMTTLLKKDWEKIKKSLSSKTA